MFADKVAGVEVLDVGLLSIHTISILDSLLLVIPCLLHLLLLPLCRQFPVTSLLHLLLSLLLLRQFPFTRLLLQLLLVQTLLLLGAAMLVSMAIIT
jgi:hypothetical protein